MAKAILNLTFDNDADIVDSDLISIQGSDSKQIGTLENSNDPAFEQDCISGNQNGEQECQKKSLLPNPPSTDDVHWLDNLLKGRSDYFYSFKEIAGGHNQLVTKHREQAVICAINLVEELRKIAKTLI